MGWVKYEKGSFPPKLGEYFIVKYSAEIPACGLFNYTPPSVDIELASYARTMKLENDCVDRCVYVKYNAFFKNQKEIPFEQVLYWYELDPIPGDD
jgi:hypothetical protein